MKRRLVLALVALSLTAGAFCQEIAYIESDRNWHRLYDAKGKHIGGYARSSVGDLVGWGSTFFITKHWGFYRIYDVKCRLIASLSTSNVGEVLSVSGNTFTSQKGSWIYIWDKSGKKLGSHSRTN